MGGEWFLMAYQRFIRVVMRVILLLVGTIELEGQENIPAGGSYILVVNHLSMADTPVVLLSMPRIRMRVFAASKWRTHPLFGQLLGLSGAIWVRRGEVDRVALAEAVVALKRGEVLGMAPEGTRSRSGVLQRARQGAAYIASRADVPLLPIGLANSDRFLPNVKRLRRTTFQVRIGKPFTLPRFGQRARSRELDAYTELIMAQIADLLPERYHGYYADSPVLAALRSGGDPWLAACQVAGLEEPEKG